jgi:hypothetical protein
MRADDRNADSLPPMSPEEINAEIKARRSGQRVRRILDTTTGQSKDLKWHHTRTYRIRHRNTA